jgi:hypothetical protein
MDRRKFLKLFSVGVVGTVVATKIPLPTPVAAVVEQVNNNNRKLANIIEIPIDRFNTMRITKFQYLTRWESFNKKGYMLTDGDKLIYQRRHYYV